MLSEQEQSVFRTCLSWAKKDLRRSSTHCKIRGLRPKHLLLTRLERIEPRYGTQKTLKKFRFTIIRHPESEFLRQVWDVHLQGKLVFVKEEGLEQARSKKKRSRHFSFHDIAVETLESLLQETEK